MRLENFKSTNLTQTLYRQADLPWKFPICLHNADILSLSTESQYGCQMQNHNFYCKLYINDVDFARSIIQPI